MADVKADMTSDASSDTDRVDLHSHSSSGAGKQSALVTPPSDGSECEVMRVLLVDDHVMVRQGLRGMLDDYPDIVVLGEASNGEEAVVLTDQLRPSIVLMDINMPKMGGIEATAHIKARHPETIVIGLSVQAGHESHLAMLKAGATKLLSKEAAGDQLYHAMQHACAPGHIQPYMK
jgi:DNA-binding NarL/FixJ family response regulator